ncbi:MAG: DUF5723 family protein [Dysgonamonadaceae bacterium]|jgi:hypothetical protein|nr:DUF5723 family protein [Dysgonamonadaceae bacterium]
MKQLYNRTKIIVALFGISFFINSAFGQSAHTEYFMSSSYFKTSLNPALRPTKGYFGIPVLTNISVGYNTNTFALENFLFPGIGENGKTGLFLNEKVSYDQFMKGISDQNYLNFDFNETLLGFGFYVGSTFLTFDASFKVNMEANIPRDVFDFLKKGVSFDGDGKTYDFSNISLDATAYGQVGLGASFPLLDKSLLLGTKVNVLLGLTNGRIGLDKMKLNIGKDEWSVKETQASVQVAMKGLKPKYNEEGKFDGFDSDDIAIGLNGLGLSFDLGAALKLGCLVGDKTSFLNNFTVSAAVTDLGFINWDKSSSLYLATDPTDVIISGDKEIDFENSENIFADLETSFKDAYNFKERPDEIEGKTNLKAKFNWGIEYAFSKANIGLLSTTYFNSAKTVSEYTIGGSVRPISGLEAGVSYSFIHGAFQTFGLSLHLGSFLYVTSDYVFPTTNSMFIPVSAKALNLQVGIAVPIGKKH